MAKQTLLTLDILKKSKELVKKEQELGSTICVVSSEESKQYVKEHDLNVTLVSKTSSVHRDYSKIGKKNAYGMIISVKDFCGNIRILVRKPTHNFGYEHLEVDALTFPKGKIILGEETPEDTAIRECLEETGVICDSKIYEMQKDYIGETSINRYFLGTFSKYSDNLWNGESARIEWCKIKDIAKYFKTNGLYRELSILNDYKIQTDDLKYHKFDVNENMKKYNYPYTLHKMGITNHTNTFMCMYQNGETTYKGPIKKINLRINQIEPEHKNVYKIAGQLSFIVPSFANTIDIFNDKDNCYAVSYLYRTKKPFVDTDFTQFTAFFSSYCAHKLHGFHQGDLQNSVVQYVIKYKGIEHVSFRNGKDYYIFDLEKPGSIPVWIFTNNEKSKIESKDNFKELCAFFKIEKSLKTLDDVVKFFKVKKYTKAEFMEYCEDNDDTIYKYGI